MNINLPDLSLVVLIGASSSGKSTFARTHFKPTEIVSSDYCRAVIANDENDQNATADAFELLHFIVAKRLKRGLLTVVDATSLKPGDRKHYIELARQYHVLPIAIVFDMPERLLKDRHHARPDRDFPESVINRQLKNLRENSRNLDREGFRYVHYLKSPEVVAVTTISRTPAWNNRQTDLGPFDIIGDVHGCYTELTELMQKLGYDVSGPVFVPPVGRRLVFVGDLVDRGPNSVEVLRLVMDLVKQGVALVVPGNHDDKLKRYLWGKKVSLNHGLAETVAELEAQPADFIEEVKLFLESLVSHYVLDEGRLVVAHAGLREEMHGRASGAVRAFCLYGETTGETDEYGLPVRLNWAADYKGRAMIVYGHTPVPEAEWLNNTIDIDTGCCFGGKLTALRYPERALVSVAAKREYAESRRPFLPETVAEPGLASMTPQQAVDDLLDIQDVTGRRTITTKYVPPITLREEDGIAALEVMSRFAINPKWLVYLPPTMSPVETSPLPDFLEHPAEAFAYYQKQGVRRVICEEKHMGSRAVVIVGQSDTVAQTRFGLPDAAPGVVYTRTGRRFFTKPDVETAFLHKLRAALDSSDFWAKHLTDWVCFDAELMPWSAKAQDLIQRQYAAVGSSATHALADTLAALHQTANRGEEMAAKISGLQNQIRAQATAIGQYRAAYRHYCREVDGIEGLVLAPFHLLATEGRVHTNQPHTWHLAQIAGICAADPAFLLATPYREVDLDNADSQQLALDWWLSLTNAGGEGMVVKPVDFVARSGKGNLIQPAVKCRGREYLRIIYGPDYDRPDHLSRLKQRNVGQKRALALREFALGLEALDRFATREPLRRIHECVIGVLGLESEPVDPRL